MPNSNAVRDDNRVPSILGVDSVTGLTVPAEADADGNLLLIGTFSAALDNLTDVTITSPQTNDVLTYNGSTWVNQAGGGGGSGTVTSVSVVTANGVSGSVATATTTPAITLTLGAITPSTVRGLTITTTTGTFTLTNAKTFAVTNSLTLSGTDGNTLTFPSGNDTVVTLTASQTLTNKTLTTPTIASFTNATHNHTNAAGGGQLTDAALSAAVGIAKGGTGQTTAALGFDALKQQATTTYVGASELTTSAEVTTGTDTTRTITADALAHSDYGKRIVGILVTDPNGSALTTGDGKAYFSIPPEMNGWNLVSLPGASVSTVSSSGLPTFQIRRVRAGSPVDMLSTAITIDANEVDSSTAATPPVINASNDDIATGDQIYIDCDVAGTGTKGVYIRLMFQLP